MILGITLMAGFGATAKSRGPQLKGESGPLPVAIIAGDEILCTDPWVSIPERTIECYSEPDDERESGIRNWVAVR